MHTITENRGEMRTPFAYCPPPSRRARLGYHLGRDLYALPIYTFGCFAAGGAAGMIVGGILHLAGIGR